MSTLTPQKDASAATPVSLTSRRGRWHRTRDGAFRGAVTGSVLVGLAVLVALILQSLVEGWPRLNLDFITSFPSSFPEKAGIQSAVFGTFWMVGIVLVVAIPIGVGAAIYMEEFADTEAWFNRFIDVIIQNLAAVPSIVYGILGLAFLARGFLNLGPVVLTAGLTLSFLVLPVVIIASREAIRAVPSSILDGALALGATRWQGVSRQVLPAAIPGIATGSIPRRVARDRRSSAPAAARGSAVHHLQPDRAEQLVHGASHPDLQLDLKTQCGVPYRRRGRHHRPSVHHPADERRGHLAPQPLPADMVRRR